MSKLLRKIGEEVTRLAGAAPDVTLVSFPKSGRTWLRFMLDSMGLKLAYTHAGSEHRTARTFDMLAAAPKQLRNRRIVFLYRDPRDTVVSGYFQASKRIRNAFEGDIHNFLRDPRHGFEKILRFNLLWMEAREGFPAFLSLGYEDLHKDAAAEVGRIARFVTGREPDRAAVEQAVEAARFDRMRKKEAQLGASKANRLGGGDPSDPESFKARRGVVGGWRDYLDEADEAYMEALLARHDYWARMERLKAQP